MMADFDHPWQTISNLDRRKKYLKQFPVKLFRGFQPHFLFAQVHEKHTLLFVFSSVHFFFLFLLSPILLYYF